MPATRLTALPWLLLPILLLSGGCLRLEKPYPQRHSYLLELTPRCRIAQPTVPGVLQLGKFAIAPAYQSRSFVYRTEERTWQSDSYHQFFTSPAAMITEQFRSWLQQRGLFEQINQGGYPPADKILQGRIVALYGDYRSGRPAAAILELRLTLIDEGSSPARTVLDRLYRRSLPLADKRPATLVKAWAEALGDIFVEFEIQLQQSVSRWEKESRASRQLVVHRPAAAMGTGPAFSAKAP